MSKINKEFVLSLSLAFVVFWFGYQEVVNPEAWVKLVPAFLASMGEKLVFMHGALLILCGFGLIFNFHRRLAAFIVALMLLDIIVILFSLGGLNDVVVRDVSLLGMALALAMKN